MTNTNMITGIKTQHDSSRRKLLKVAVGATLISSSLASASTKGVFVLVSDDEYSQATSKAASIAPSLEIVQKSVYPRIIIESPSLNNEKLSSPLDIFVRFEASEGASIAMDSLTITYGFFMDITSRILENAEIGSDFVQAAGAELPKGKHSFTVRIKDSNGAHAEQEFDIVVS